MKAAGHIKLSLSFSLSGNTRLMAGSCFDAASRKLIQIDVISDTVCPWCFVGKKNIEKAMDLVKDQFDFEVRWHPYFLNPSAPKEGIKKSEHYNQKFGVEKSKSILSRMTQVFRGLGLEYDTSGLTGNTLDSHRLIALAAHQGYDKQNALVEELFFNYFCEGKYIGNHQVLLDAARKAGVEGAAELLEDPNKLLEEVNEELEKYPARDTGVPLFLINGEQKIVGGQPPEVFLKAFQAIAESSTYYYLSPYEARGREWKMAGSLHSMMLEKMTEGNRLGDDIDDVEESLIEKLNQILYLLEKLYDFLVDTKSEMLHHWTLTLALPVALATLIFYCCYCRRNKKRKEKKKAVEKDDTSDSGHHGKEVCLDLYSWDFKVSWW
ncbi:hypothetical protein J5N97_028649 [Dioscorea zingiberensis]|uniref:DSBA-like thioredoxin domain-containing protein n=1 Tax=Dioscorea zingiberensis TaxID=325984 RepID=A0A9D5H531_9LILI|nr:hypothetical protein J5N97_028649 [Dioscorea zingiberensis]